MREYNGWLKSMKAMCYLLRRTYTKERLKATCFSDEPASLQWPLVGSFTGHIVDGRWGSVSEAAVALCPLETPLR